MRQSIKYLRSIDGTNLAWTRAGDGPLLIKAANWLSHLEYDLKSPVWSHWVRFFADHFDVVRYDERGCGMSDRNVEDVSFDRWVEDLEAVADAAAPGEKFAIVGMSQGASVALAYAARHPERVSRLILYGGYARGWKKRDDPETERLVNSIIETMTLGWNLENPVFRRLFTSRFIPGASEEQIGWFNDLCVNTMSADMAARLMIRRSEVDVQDVLPRIAAPTFVAHSRDDQPVPLEEGRYLAQNIRGAEFLMLDSANHILLQHEAAWGQLKSAILEFMAPADETGRGARAELNALSTREREIFDLICEAKTYPDIAAALSISEKTVRNHASNIFKTLGVKSRSEAMLYRFNR